MRGLSKLFRAPIYWAHRAVVFAIARLSCYFVGPILIRHSTYTVTFKFNLIKSMVRVELIVIKWSASENISLVVTVP